MNEDEDLPVIYCKGCGVAFKHPGSPFVHENGGDCWARWEYGCLVNIKDAARDLLDVLRSPFSVENAKDQLAESLDALNECHENEQR